MPVHGSRSTSPFAGLTTGDLKRVSKGNQVLTVNVKQLFETLDDASAHIIRLSDPDVDLPLASDDNLSQGTARYNCHIHQSHDVPHIRQPYHVPCLTRSTGW